MAFALGLIEHRSEVLTLHLGPDTTKKLTLYAAVVGVSWWRRKIPRGLQ